MKKPNLFILGAPKCGTTALASWLGSHPDVFASPIKEPHYFSEEYRLTPTLAAYEGLFEQADESTRWVCEASVWQLFSDAAVPAIRDYAPHARFVVALRNPVELARSLHEQQRFNGNELVHDFHEALALNDARAEGEGVGVRAGYPASHLAYYLCASLGWQVARLLDRVPRQNIHFVVYDDLAADPERTYAGLLEFLGLAPHLPRTFAKVNPAKRRKSFLMDAAVLRLADIKRRLGWDRRFGVLASLRKWNVLYRPRSPLDPHLRTEMARTFEADVELLGRLLERDLAHWVRTPGPREAAG